MNVPEQPSSTGPWGEPESWQSYTGPPAEKPRTIRNAVRMMYVGAALSVLGIIIAFMQRDEIREQILESDDSLTADELDTAVAVGLAFVTVIGLIGVGLWLWMAATNGQGKSWARIVATVLGALNIAFTLFGLALGQTTPLAAVVSLVGIVLAAVILILLYRPESNRYYDAMAPR